MFFSRPLRLVASAAAGALAFRQIHSFDLFWHLRVGEEILINRAIPATDPFSFTADRTWINHEWLAEVVLALVNRLGGYTGLGLFTALTVAALVFLLTKPNLAPSALPAAVLAGTVLAFNAEPRAMLLSWLIVGLGVRLAAAESASPSGKVFLFVPLQALLSNLHGGNPFIVAIAGLLLVSGVFSAPRDYARHILRGLAGLGVLLATFASPYGLRVHDQMSKSSQLLPEIREWQPLGQLLADGSLPHFAFLALLALAGLGLWQARATRPVLETLLLLVFGFVAVKYIRFTSEATLVALFAATRHTVRLPARLALPAAAALTVLVFSTAPRAWGAGLETDRFPEGAAAWLRQNPASVRSFNSYNYGGYLMWALPEQKVYIDGRAFTVYSNDHFSSLLDVYATPTKFDALVAKWDLNQAILQRFGRGAGLVALLEASPAWEKVFVDNISVVFRRR